MNPAGAFIQVVFIIVACGIGITYLQPTFVEIQGIQDDIQYYEEEIEKVQQVNARLSQLVSQQNSMLRSDRLALVTYIPDEVDVLSVMKDIVAIGEEADFEVSAIANAVGGGSSYFEGSRGTVPAVTTFSVELNGEYDQFKTFLQLLEQNEYQLSVSELGITPQSLGEDADEDVAISLTLMAFSLPDLTSTNQATN